VEDGLPRIADGAWLWNAERMAGRFILTLSAVALFIGGGACLFAPDELARLLDPTTARGLPVAIQLLGGSFLGFALMNWMSRRNRIGGIYARPLGIGNLLLFTTGALTLGKAVSAGSLPAAAEAVCALFAAIAASFAWLVFVHDPLSDQAAKIPV
jgi:hypothetical protein